MSDKIITAIKKAGYEVQALQEEARLLVLPDNPTAWLDQCEQDISAQPDDLPQKDHILRQIGSARRSLAKGDEPGFRLCLLRIRKNFENARHDLWVIGIENRKKKELKGSRNGGLRSKRKPWAEAAAAAMMEIANGCTERQAWEKIPSELKPWEFELDGEFDAEVYRDGTKLVAVNSVTKQPIGKGELAKSTFFKNYYRPAKNSGK